MTALDPAAALDALATAEDRHGIDLTRCVASYALSRAVVARLATDGFRALDDDGLARADEEGAVRVRVAEFNAARDAALRAVLLASASELPAQTLDWIDRRGPGYSTYLANVRELVRDALPELDLDAMNALYDAEDEAAEDEDAARSAASRERSRAYREAGLPTDLAEALLVWLAATFGAEDGRTLTVAYIWTAWRAARGKATSANLRRLLSVRRSHVVDALASAPFGALVTVGAAQAFRPDRSAAQRYLRAAGRPGLALAVQRAAMVKAGRWPEARDAERLLGLIPGAVPVRYRDALDGFIHGAYEPDEDARTAAPDLLADLRQWALDEGRRELLAASARELYAMLASRGYGRRKSNGRHYVLGLRRVEAADLGAL